MSKAYIRYTRKQDELNGARGLLVTALKKTARPHDYRCMNGAIHPNDYRYCYRPEDFLKMDVVMENRTGAKANLDRLQHLLPREIFDGDLTWVLAAVLFTWNHIELYHVGFDMPHIIAESTAFVLIDSRQSYAQTSCNGACGVEISVGHNKFVVRFDVDSGGIRGLPNEYANINTVASEYHRGVLFCDYFIPDNSPIIIHQYLPEE